MFILTDAEGNPLETNKKDIQILPGSTIYFKLNLKTTTPKTNFSFFIRPRAEADYNGSKNAEFDFNALVNYSYADNCGIFVNTGTSWEKVTPERGISPETAILLNNGVIDPSMSFTVNFRIAVPPITKKDSFSLKGIKALNFVFRGAS